MREQNKQMALLTIFTMILVIIGHCDMTENFYELWIYKWIYSFHMPMFFFISGFLFCLTNPLERLDATPYLKFMSKKAVRLLIPFLFINTLIFIVKALFIKDTSMMQHPVEFTFSDFLYRTFMAPIGFMWFLPALFSVFAMAFPLWKFILERHSNWCGPDCIVGGGSLLISLIIVMCSAMLVYEVMPDILFMRISSAIYQLLYFFFGVLYCVYKESLDKYLRKYWIFILLLSGLLSMSLVLSGRLAAITGILFCVTFSLLLADKVGSLMLRLSQYTYTVFLLAYFPQMFVRGPMAHHFLDRANEYLLSALSFVVGLGLPLIVCEIYTRIRENNRLLNLLGRLIGL